ncbi:fibroblast growth factor receptor-like 1 isoform X2 [Penaeus indicus]|uniref:fibroblast growth factor receptor-like 1 isoform X2 n=1 Tax=Penaeus indicus TaxID=29960 RepID=UPI00300BFDE9
MAEQKGSSRTPLWAWVVLWALIPPSVCGGGIKGEPRVTERWEARKVVRQGDVVKLPCPITANPAPFYEWFKDREEVRASWQRYNTKNHILRIKTAKVEDSGTYTCLGVNGFGQVNVSMHLIVLGSDEPPGNVQVPILTEVDPKGSIQRRQGESVTLTCRAKGLPTPTVTWHKDGLDLGKIGQQISFNSLLPTDSGLYTCKAISALGETSANFSIHVGEPKEEQELEISDAVNTTVVEGGSTALQCTVRTSHQPTILWLKEIPPDTVAANASGVSADKSHHVYQLGERPFKRVEGAGAVVAKGDRIYLSKMTISNATPSHAGVYACLGLNTLGYSYKEAHLTVLSKEAGVQTPPVGSKDRNVNWLFFIIPAIVIIVVVVAVIVCQLRKAAPDKPVGGTPPTPVLKGDDPSALAPLNPDTHGHSLTSRPPDLVYQEVSGYAPSSLRGAPHGSHYGEQYPSPYPESYVDPAYSDPYSGDRGPTRASDHSYARLTHPSHPSHPSLASHNSHNSHASSSPHLPPPYAHAHPHAHTHSHAHTHRHPQYFVHYNL